MSSDIISPEEYLIKKARLAKDSYETNAWIITAKSLFPTHFMVQFLAYDQEKTDKNVEAAARSLSYIVLTFQNQPILFNEVSKITDALRLPGGQMTEEQEFYLTMFKYISFEVQQKILMLTANHLDSTLDLDHCRLILLLMKRFHQAIPQHAQSLLETLISSTNPQYRDMLIQEALPLILQNPPELPTNLVQLVLGVTIEYYVEQVFRRFTDGHATTESWHRIFETLEACGRLMKWEKFISFSPSCGKDVYWTRLVQIVASAGSSQQHQQSKQIFYTSIVVFIYSLQEYMSRVSKREDKDGTTSPEYHLVELKDLTVAPSKRRHSDAFNQDPVKILVSDPVLKETPTCLITAAHCWQLINSNELLQLESNQLLVRLPIGDWVTRFVSDLAVYLGRADDFQAILKSGTAVRATLEKDVKLLSLAVLQNCNAGMNVAGPLILNICKELAQTYSTNEIPQGEYLKELSTPGSVGGAPCGGRSLLLLPMTKRAILQYCVRILIAKLSARMHNLIAEPSDNVLGYLLILLQLNWPSGMATAVQVFNLITTKRSLRFLSFSKYMVHTEFVEEFAFMWSQHGGEVNLELTSSPKARHSFGTRRADKGVKDDFKQILRDQIQRSHEDMDFLVIMFILQEHNQLFAEILQ